jgi:hypothetical protein
VRTAASLRGKNTAPPFRLMRLFQSEKGIWRYEIEKRGKRVWSSLNTRDEAKAREFYERMQRTIDRWQEDERA